MCVRSLLSMVCLLLGYTVNSTTIIAPKNLSELGQLSEVVVFAQCINAFVKEVNEVQKHRFTFKLLENVSGHIENEFVIQNMHFKIGDLERTVINDVEFIPGKSYLLFLSHLDKDVWKTRILSYGIYEEKYVSGKAYLSPIIQNAHGILNKDEVEPLFYYDKSKLLPHLKKVLQHGRRWQSKTAKIKPPLEVQLRSAPAHCTFFSEGAHARWDGFPDKALPVRISSSGDPGCPEAEVKVHKAIDIMNNSYSGINLSYAGTHTYIPPNSCGDATGNNFVSHLRNNRRHRSITIQFNDPCNEMDELNNCGGVLAYGGLYWTNRKYKENGQTYKYALYGHVVTNKGFGKCYGSSDKYIYTLVHEMGHALGFGHISGSEGKANMNPSNPGPATSLDIKCFDYLYPGTITPGCLASEELADVVISNSLTIKASEAIAVSNITVANNSTLTLIAPSISINSETNMLQNAKLVTINANQCN